MHSDHGKSDYTDKVENAAVISIVLNVLFVIIEIVGGLYTNSFSILSDAVHDMGDVLSLVVSYVLIRLSKKERNVDYNFGLKGLITLGAFLNTVVVLTTSLFILTKSFDRLLNPQTINGVVMFLIAVLGVVLNGLSVYKFHNKNDVMSKSLMLHLLEDTLGWVAVLISSIFIIVFKVYIIDTILSILIATFLIVNCIKNLVRISKVLLYKVPKGISYEDIEEGLLQKFNVNEILDMKIWSLEGKTNYCILNISINNELSVLEVERIKTDIKAFMKERDIQNVYIETSGERV